MACFPYSPALKPPGNWIRIDFADPRLAPAIQMMVQQIQIDISAYTPSNHMVCEKLGAIGVKLDEQPNQHNACVISASDSTVTVRVIPTDEELGIARRTYELS